MRWERVSRRSRLMPGISSSAIVFHVSGVTSRLRMRYRLVPVRSGTSSETVVPSSGASSVAARCTAWAEVAGSQVFLPVP